MVNTILKILLILLALFSGGEIEAQKNLENIDVNKYTNIVKGRLINSWSGHEISQLTDVISISVLVDRKIKGKVESMKELAPSGKIESRGQLICLNNPE